MVKDEAEIDALRSACRISVEALEQLLQGPFVGRTEREVARDLEWRMYALGAEAIGFDTIVAAGPHSAIPHHDPTDRRLRDRRPAQDRLRRPLRRLPRRLHPHHGRR